MSKPTVAIVTPVYNGADYIEECVSSVLAQSYRNWIHYVADNNSTDATVALAAKAAGGDERVRILRHDKTLRMLDNWNRAMTTVDEGIPYIKHLSADDLLHPECLAEMVNAAERHPQAAIVGSYFDYGGTQLPDCAYQAPTRIPGHDVVRDYFLGRADYLAQPSALLLRRSMAPHWPHLFNPEGFPPGHPNQPPLCGGDKEAYLPVLQHHDLVFVPSVLSILRADETSATSFSANAAAWHVSRIELLLRFKESLNSTDYRKALRYSIGKYLRSIAWRFVRLQPWRDEEFVRYQHLALPHVVKSLRACGDRTEAATLAPFARFFARRARMLLDFGGHLNTGR